nr:response regulator transcription factor [Leucobacter edaphi]
MLREGLALLLKASGHEVVASVASGPELERVFAEWDADLAVVDIRMPPTGTDEGLRAALAARSARPGLPVLLFSQYVERLYVRELLTDGAGGVGYLLKDRVSDPREFLDAMQRVADGGTVIDPTVIASLIGGDATEQTPGRRTGDGQGRSSGLAALTPRETEVIQLLAEGRSNAAIGERLFLSESATTKHISAIFDKLGLPPSGTDNRRVLAVLAYLGA